MSERSEADQKPKRIGLFGASFETGNLGVSALAESSIKIILNRWPDAEITLLGSGYVPREHCISLSGKEICVKTLPIRFCKNIFLPYHFLWFVFYGLLVKVLPTSRLKNAVANRNPHFKMLYETDLVADITGGDSFSDMYGMRRFTLGFLRKWIVLLFNKDLIMLPQTYGPFKGNMARAMARYILKKASLVYSRDRAGVGDVKKLLNNPENEKVRFAPDVGFVLDSREPQNTEISELRKLRAEDAIVVGLNISGLLYNGGHTRNERFGLKTDYRQLVYQIARLLLENDKVKLLLVPHVVPPAPARVNDAVACLEVYKQLAIEYQGRIFLVKGEYDQGEIKYVIGLCDFFIGSRMHSCIAALSQGIPAVGIAYSKKFAGVFDSIGTDNLVIDLRTATEPEVLSRVEEIFINNHKMTKELSARVAEVQRKVLSILQEAL